MDDVPGRKGGGIMRTCCCCGVGYNTKGKEDKLIYGCRACHKGTWQANERELKAVEVGNVCQEQVFPYGKPQKHALQPF